MSLFRSVTTVGLLLLKSALGLAAQVTSQEPPSALIIVGGTVVNPAADGPSAKLDVRIEGDQIIEIGPRLPVPRGARVVDAHGKYVVPGLWDMHAHLAALTAPGHAPERFVGYGVLGVRDMGGHADVLFALRRDIDARHRVGPAIFMAGPTLNGEPAADFHLVVRTDEEARAAVRRLQAQSVDFIKIHRKTTRAAFDAIADETRKLHMTFCGHVPLVMNWIEASNGGMHTIEHVQTLLENEPVRAANPVDGAFLTLERIEGPRGDEIFATMARNGTYFDPTLVGYEVTWEGDPPELKALKQKAYARMKPLVGRAARAGVRILAGTDVLKEQGDPLLTELERLVEAGLSPRESLAAATTTAFAANGRGPGRIAVHAEASLLLLDADPYEDIRNVRKLSAVILRGRVMDAPELARLRGLAD